MFIGQLLYQWTQPKFSTCFDLKANGVIHIHNGEPRVQQREYYWHTNFRQAWKTAWEWARLQREYNRCHRRRWCFLTLQIKRGGK